jgi:hypothetical protein
MLICLGLDPAKQDSQTIFIGIDFESLKKLQAGEKIVGRVDSPRVKQRVVVFAARDNAMITNYLRTMNPEAQMMREDGTPYVAE